MPYFSPFFFRNMLSAIFVLFHLLCFCWWLCSLKWPPSIKPRCYLVFPKCKKTEVWPCRNTCVRHTSFRHELPAVGHDFNVHESTKYIKVSLSRNTPKTKHILIRWQKRDQRPTGNWLSTFAMEQQFSIHQLNIFGDFWGITTLNNKSGPYFEIRAKIQ